MRVFEKRPYKINIKAVEVVVAHNTDLILLISLSLYCRRILHAIAILMIASKSNKRIYLFILYTV